MRKVGLVLAIFATLTLVSTVSAQKAKGFDITATNWDTDEAGDTFGVGLRYHFGGQFGGEVRAAYFEELENEPFETLFGGSTPFESGLQILPLELGLRMKLDRDEAGVFHPYISAGVSYFILDSDTGNLDDETGFYLAAGARFGDGEGIDFVAEVSNRWAEGTVRDLGDLDGDGFDEDDIPVDLNGLAISVGIGWHW